MMRKVLGGIFLVNYIMILNIIADEGMWLLPKIGYLNIDSMQKRGLKLHPDSIWSLSNPSLKDAVIIFGNGCTGEVVSSEGLIFTNHHCGYDAIQSLSSVAHDYLNDGFWAKNKSEELSCKGLSVSFVKRFENVTDSILDSLSTIMDEEKRNTIIDSRIAKMEKIASKDDQYMAEVKSFYSGNEYYLVVYEVFKDIRLVGSPPTSIGKFGGDTDNWMWPRHTADFSVFRIYADSTNKPQNYCGSNIPYKPKKFFTISLNGVEKDSFTMTIGYPGMTERYITSAETREIMEVINPGRIKIRGARQNILQKEMEQNHQVQIQYAAKYALSSNYWKYSIGQNARLVKLNVIERKKEQENKFLQWANQDSVRKLKYGSCINEISSSIEEREPYLNALHYYYEALFKGVDILGFAKQFVTFYEELCRKNPDTSTVNKSIVAIKNYYPDFFRNFSISADQKVANEMFAIFSANIDAKFKSAFYLDLERKYKNSWQKYLAKIYSKTFLADSNKVREFLENPSSKRLKSDPVFMFTYQTIQKYREIYSSYTSSKILIQKGQRNYLSGIEEMYNKKVFYPDANFTMRLSYGIVKDYYPMDAVHYDYKTTLAGLINKEDTTNPDFEVPVQLKKLFYKKEYGRYSKTSEMPLCFISTNDITGGNSGSPVINGRGELIGIAFDGNWEAMSGDIIYEPSFQRTISVDIRFVLFIIDKFAGAKNIINELKINNL
jgi:hypothetical protein